MKQIILQLPGWLGSGPGHWQSQWEQQWGDQRVEQVDWQQPLRGDWQIALQEHMWSQQQDEAISTRFVLVAHGLACHLIAAWAAHSPHVDWVSAALLVAPPDLSPGQDLAAALPTWSPPILQTLPFPSVMLSSDNDTYASPEASAKMAWAWGCAHQVLPQAGHLDADSGLGAWPQGRVVLNDLMASTT